MLRDGSGVGTERAHADDRVLGIRIHVHHGRQVETDAQAGQTRAHRRRDLGGQARVAGGPEREVARVAAAGARVEARHVAAFLIDRHHQLGMLRVERGGQLGDLFVRLHVAGEQHDPSQPLRRPPPDPAGRDGALEPRKDAAQRKLLDSGHPLTAPAVSPPARYRCRMRKKATTGTPVRVAAAISGPHSGPWLVVNDASHTVSVWLLGLERRT